MVDASAGKRSAAIAAADLVENGMRIGLGTGSTVRFALERLAARVAEEGLEVAGVPTSRDTEQLARTLGIPLVDLDAVESLDLAIDGADEVDGRKHLIKGGGGALVREKIVAAASRELVVIVDEGKMVERLGAFPLPVEVMAFGWRQCQRAVQALGCEPALRRAPGGEPFLSDNGNFVLDCKFAAIEDPARLHDALNAIAGVVDNGLFVDLAGRVFVGDHNGGVRRMD